MASEAVNAARQEYDQAVKHARTACGSCRSLRCPYCQKILAAHQRWLDLILKGD